MVGGVNEIVILNGILYALRKNTKELESARNSEKGVEKFLYPYFNAELSKGLNGLSGIGNGRLSLSYGGKEIDCLLIFDNDIKVGIEIKGPSKKSFLISGAEGDYEDKYKDLIKCLKNKKNGNSDNFKKDSHIGDIVKLAEFVNDSSLLKAYCVGILVSKERSKQNEFSEYERMLICGLSCVDVYFSDLKFELSYFVSDELSVAVDIVAISKYPLIVTNKNCQSNMD